MSNTKRALVTGGAGFIGSHVSDALVAEGYEVLVVDDLSSGRRPNVPKAARFVQLDIRDGVSLERVVAAFRPHVVSHQAAQISVSVSSREPVRDAEVNVLGTLHLLEACVAHGVEHVVFASTGGAIYGEIAEPERAAVGRTPLPLSPYACAKFAVEGYLRRYQHEKGLRSTILRYANVYGPRQDPHGEAGVVAIFAERLLAGLPIKVNARREAGDPGCIRDYVYVGDVVKANVRAVSGKISAPIVNVGSGVPTTTLDLARMLERALHVTANLGYGPRREGDVERSLLEPSQEAIGEGAAWTPLERGIAETASWFEEKHRP